MRDESRGCGSDVAGEGVENTKCVSEDELDSLILGNGMHGFVHVFKVGFGQLFIFSARHQLDTWTLAPQKTRGMA